MAMSDSFQMGVLNIWFAPALKRCTNLRLGTAAREGGKELKVTRMVTFFHDSGYELVVLYIRCMGGVRPDGTALRSGGPWVKTME